MTFCVGRTKWGDTPTFYTGYRLSAEGLAGLVVRFLPITSCLLISTHTLMSVDTATQIVHPVSGHFKSPEIARPRVSSFGWVSGRFVTPVIPFGLRVS